MLEQPALAAGHLGQQPLVPGLVRGEPGQLERVLLGRAVALHRHDVGQRDRVLARVVEGGHAGRREVFGDRERLRRERHPRQRQRPEVLLQVPQQRRAHPLVIEHPAGHEGPGDPALSGHPQQQADRGDHALRVDPDRDGVDVEDRQPRPGGVQLLAAEPAAVRLRRRLGHGDLSIPQNGGRERAPGAYCPTMTSRRRTTLPSILVAGALLAGGCTGDTGPAGSAETPAGDAPAAALAKPPTAATTVAAGRTPGEITAAISRSLFASAPVVVVALAGDAGAVSAGAAEAERRGVPMLLDDGPAAAGDPTTPSAAPDGTAASGESAAPDGSAAPGGTAAPGGPAAPDPTDGTGAPGAPDASGAAGTAAGAGEADGNAGSAATGVAPESDPVPAEVTRLKPDSVLALGAGVADRLASTGAKVVTDAAQLPEVGRPQAAGGTTVLIDQTAEATATAVTTTGRAAGARVA